MAEGGDALAALLQLLSPTFAFLAWLWVLRDNGVMVVQARSPCCPSLHEPAWSQGFRIPADNFPNEVAHVCDSVGKTPVWLSLDAAFPSHFVRVA